MKSAVGVVIAFACILLIPTLNSTLTTACVYKYHTTGQPIVVLGGLGEYGNESHTQSFLDVAYGGDSYYAVGNAYVLNTSSNPAALDNLAVILKLDSNFMKEWVSVISGPGYDAASSVAVSPRSNLVYVTGQTTSYGFGESDAFIAVYKPMGVLEKYVCIGSRYVDWGEFIKFYGDKLYVVGATNNTSSGKLSVLILELNPTTLSIEKSYVITGSGTDFVKIEASGFKIYNGLLVIPALLVYSSGGRESYLAYISVLNLTGNQPSLLLSKTLLAGTGNVSSVKVYPTNNCIYVALSTKNEAYGVVSDIVVFKMYWNGSVDTSCMPYMSFNGEAYVTSVRYDESSGKLYVSGVAQNLSGDNTYDLFTAVFNGNLIPEDMYYYEPKLSIGGSTVTFNYDSFRTRFVNNKLVTPGFAVATKLVGNQVVCYATLSIFNPQFWSYYAASTTPYIALIDVSGLVGISLEPISMNVEVVSPEVTDYTNNYITRVITGSNTISVRASQENVGESILTLSSNATIHTNYFGSGYRITINTTLMVNNTVTSNGLFLGSILAVRWGL